MCAYFCLRFVSGFFHVNPPNIKQVYIYNITLSSKNQVFFDILPQFLNGLTILNCIVSLQNFKTALIIYDDIEIILKL